MMAQHDALRSPAATLEDLAIQSFIDNIEESVRLDAQKDQPKIGLREFSQEAWHIVEPVSPFVGNWHIDAICDHLDAVSSGEIVDLLINMPPGCMKSLLVSVFFPAKEWTHNPEYRYLSGSYDDQLSIRDNRKMRNIVESAWYQSRWPLRFKRDQNTKTKIENERTGWRIATSVGGKGTGEHPHRKLIDDPHNVKKSLSSPQRKEAITWFDLTMGSRGVNIALHAATIITMQRLHQEDLSGHVMEKFGRQFTVLCLPMRYEPPVWVQVNGVGQLKRRMEPTKLGFQDPRKKKGELLWPALFPEPTVQKLEGTLRATHGEFGVAGQLQQRPVPQKGGLIKREWFRIVDRIPADEVIVARVRGWDCAATEDAGDWTVGVRMAFARSGRVYVEHVIRGQWGPEQFEGERGIFKQTVQADGRAVRQREEQEPGSAGKKVIRAHANLLTGFDYKGEPSSGDKVTRNAPFRSAAAVGNVVLVAGDWNQPYLDVLTVFPNGTHDDDVDGSSTAFNDVTQGSTAAVTEREVILG